MSKVFVARNVDDSICPRVSCGGRPGLAPNGDYYCVYRGSLDEAVRVLEECLGEMKRLQSLPPAAHPKIDPRGKPFLGFQEPSKS